jgi:thiamine biosynthesis lipoprotein
MTQQKEETNSLTRRRFLKWTAGGAAAAAGLTLGIRPWQKTATGTTTVSSTRPAMGTFVEITARGEDEKKTTELIDKAYSRIKEVDEKMSVYKEGSLLKGANNPGVSKLDLDPSTMEVLTEAQQVAELTDGGFDATAGPLLKLWGFYEEELTVPSKEQLEETLKLVDYRGLDLNPSTGTATLPDPDSRLDLGGIAKGYGVDEAVEVLKEGNLEAGLVNAGGDIRGFGGPEGEDSWTVGLQNPLKEKDLLAGMDLLLPAVTTSGNYESFFTYDGSKLAHIIDPKTGRPVEDVLSVSVMTDTAVRADGLSTAAFSQGSDGALTTAAGLDDTEMIYIHRNDSGRIAVGVTEGLEGVVDSGKLERGLNARI